VFENYQNVPDNYIPNNLSKYFPKEEDLGKLVTVASNNLFEVRNIEEDLVGFTWSEGDSVTIKFLLSGSIFVEEDSILYYNKGESPSSVLEGFQGQRAYNILDLNSWTCDKLSDGRLTWVQDISFTFPNSGKRLELDLSSYIEGKSLQFIIYNFRHEPIFTKTLAGSSEVTIVIDKELSDKLVKGIYYCSLKLANNTIFDTTDGILVVK
jgi:hypothetical protein